MNEYVIYKSQNNFARETERLKASKLSDKTKTQIEDFARIRLAKGSTKLRVVKCMWCLRYLATWMKEDFSNATKGDIIRLISEMDSKGYAPHTVYDFKIVLKMFYKWLLGNDEEFPEVIKWLKPKLKNVKHKLPEELLTVEEAQALANATTNPRDKALLLILYESGCRIGELLYMNLKNIQFDNYGAVLIVNGKTGSRRVRIIASVQVLTQWLAEHPDKDNPNAPLWPGRFARYKPVPSSYPSIIAMLRRAQKACGIRKRIYPHLFRHSRATALATKLTEAQMKEYFGWTQGSEMAATYVHLSGRDVDSALLQMYSIKQTEEDKAPKLEIRICNRCKEKNSPTQTFCGKCGNPLDEKTLLVDPRLEFITALMKDEEAREFLTQKAVSLGLDITIIGG